jgi:hypothetical protein
MDIAKYIGLFLLKTNYCYIPGLGNLEIKKLPASHDGQNLKAPSYEVIVTPGGSIDDSLANFIATNEQISISKASNALREFSTEAKADLNAGKDVIIPALGKFTGQSGRVQFITDPHMQYTPRAIPTVKHVAAANAENRPKTPAYSNPNIQSKQTNWGKIALFIAIPVILIIAVVMGMNYMSSKPAETVAVPMTEEAVVETPLEPAVTDSTAIDSNAVATETPASNVQMNNGMLSFKLILKDYKTNAAAEKRVSQLNSYGNNVEVVMKDSSTWYVVMPVTALAADTAHVIDSIRRMYNPKGVTILQ